MPFTVQHVHGGSATGKAQERNEAHIAASLVHGDRKNRPARRGDVGEPQPPVWRVWPRQHEPCTCTLLIHLVFRKAQGTVTYTHYTLRPPRSLKRSCLCHDCDAIVQSRATCDGRHSHAYTTTTHPFHLRQLRAAPSAQDKSTHEPTPCAGARSDSNSVGFTLSVECRHSVPAGNQETTKQASSNTTAASNSCSRTSTTL